MKRKFFSSLIIAVFCVLSSSQANAQDNSSVEVKKFELGAEFVTLTSSSTTKLGLGGRFTYNLNSHIALEAAGYFFPQDCNFCGSNSGRTTQGLFGVKIGKRFSKWGIFAKVRPGVDSTSKGEFDFVLLNNPPTTAFSFAFVQKRSTNFAVDGGAVLEFYPTKRIITRMDFGILGVRHGQRTINVPAFDPVTGLYSLRTTTIPAQNLGTFQITAGVGYRF